jgi:hypothetical protein
MNVFEMPPRKRASSWTCSRFQHLLSLHAANLELICLALALIILLSFGECMQLQVPIRFQRGSYESIIRIDTEKTAASQFRFVASSIHLKMAESIGFISA